MHAASPEAGLAPPSPLARLLGARRAWLGMDRDPAALAWAGTPAGQILLHIAFMAALAATFRLGATALGFVAIALAGCALWPRRRLAVLVGSSVVFLLLRPFRTAEFAALPATLAQGLGLEASHAPWLIQIGGVLAFLAYAQIVVAMRRSGSGWMARRPVASQGIALGLALGLGWAFLPPGSAGHAALFAFASVWASCFWLLAYALAEQGAKTAPPDAVRAAYMRPFWGGDAAPFGKGTSFLARFEAKDETALAATRLKALKLAVWAVILGAALAAVENLAHDRAGIPRLSLLVLDPAQAEAQPLAMLWVALIVNFATDLLGLAVWGHALIAIARMAGYALPRNTANPLASRTLAEFWNRYYYYFKEVLVDFFFYPAFVRFFKAQPKLRIACATICAAGLGNLFYHMIFAGHVFAVADLATILDLFATIAVYVAILSAGLVISQLRGRKARPEDGFWRWQVLPRVGVIGFFCLLKIFDVAWMQGELGNRFLFVFSLFGA